MNFQVLWDPDVVALLQQLHDTSPDPEAIRLAVRRVGLELSQVPLEAGESRGDNRRVLFKFPLILWYTVNERLQTVLITSVRLLRP